MAGLLGVQSLTISLSVAMVFCTVIIVGGITISSGIDLLNKARDTGDEGVAMCLTSTDNDIKGLATTYLLNVLGNTQRDLEGFLDTPANAIRRMADYAQAHHPNVSTSPHFIEDKMRPYIRTAYNELQDAGVEILAYDALPFSPAHPDSWVPDKVIPDPSNQFGNGIRPDYSSAGWGSYVSYFLADDGTGGVLAPGQKVVMFTQTADAVTLKTSHSNYMVMGEADQIGAAVHPPSTGCRIGTIRYDKGENMGLCVLPRFVLYDAAALESHARMWRNIYTDDGPLNPPDVPYFQPMVTSKHRMLLSIAHTFTHPEQVNVLPRQGKRVGALLITVEGDLLRQMLQDLVLPNGTHLYAVQDNHWTGEKGTLIAYNKGRVANTELKATAPGVPRKIVFVTLMNIVNHTVEQTNGTARNPPSTIAQHGRHTLSLDGGYANASATSKAVYSEWTSETNAFETGLTYWTVTAPVTRGDLKWFVSLLIPRETVMGRIDVSTAAIREKSRKSRQESDDQQREKYIVLSIVVCLSAVCLVAVAVVFTRVIVAPLNSLALDMANVAIMRLECVDLEQRSSLSEVRSMQESFVQMVANLIEYRNYMPQAVLVETEEESEHEQSQGVARSRAPSSGEGSHMSYNMDSSTVQASVIRMKEQQRTLTSDGLRKKCVTMAYYNACGWHALTTRMDSLEVCDLHGRYVETVLTTMKAYKSVCESFSGDRIVTTFNAFQALSTHRPSALRAMLKLREDLGKIVVNGKALEYSCAAVTGDARVGSMGCKGMKKLSIMSPCFPWLMCLERYACARSYGEVVDHSLARDVMCEFVLKLTDAVLYAKRASNQLKVYQLHEECKVGGDEWMYQMEKAAATSPAAAWNAAFTAALAGDWDDARGQIARVDVNTTVCNLRILERKHCSNANTQDLARLKNIVARQHYDPVVIEWH